MYLILPQAEAEERNRYAAFKSNMIWRDSKRWAETPFVDGRIALNVDDGDGLTDEEIALCVNELPKE